MTDKIIIDGVDVSGCEYFSSGLGYCTIGLLADDGTHICECEQNCYYKMWQRAEHKLAKIEEVITHHYCNPQIAHTGCKYDEMILQIIEGKENE